MIPARRLCFVSSEFPGLTRGGIGASVATLASGLAGRGWQVVVLASGLAAEELARLGHTIPDIPDGVDLIGAFDPRFDEITEPVPAWAHGHDLTAIAVRASLCVEHLAGQQRFDLIEVHDYQGLGSHLLKRRRLLGGPLAATPIVIRLHGTAEICLEHEDVSLVTAGHRRSFQLERYALAHADAIVCASADYGRWFAQRFDIQPDRLVVSPLPFVPVELPPGEVAPHPLTVTFVGKVQRLKGVARFVDEAVRAMRTSRPDLRAVVVGGDSTDLRNGGSLLAGIQARIPLDLRANFEFTGHVDRSVLTSILRRCDMVVFPNHVETFCLVAYELLSTGLPYVMSGIPAFDSVAAVREELGLTTVRFGDAPGSLVEAIEKTSAASGRSDIDVELLRWRGLGAYVELADRAVLSPPDSSPSDDDPRVTVIVPYYNMQDYVEETVASLLRCDYDDLEVIVVDDGSSDPVAAAAFDSLERRLAADHRFVFLRKPNGGLGSARNAGIGRATGAYILPLDSDDLIEPAMITTLVRALRRNPELDVVSCYVRFFEDSTTLAPVDFVVPYDLDPLLIALENRAGVASSMFRREVFDDLRYDEWLWSFEDWSMWWSLAAAGRRAEVLPEVLFNYRRRHGSMVKGVTPTAWASLINHIASRHRALLERHAVDVYTLVMSAFVETRAEMHRLMSVQPSTPSAVSEAIVSEARSLRESRSFHIGMTIRRTVRRLMRPLAHGAWQVRVRTIDRAAIDFLGSRFGDGGVYSLGGICHVVNCSTTVDEVEGNRILRSQSGGASFSVKADDEVVHLRFRATADNGQIEVCGPAGKIRVPAGTGEVVEVRVGRASAPVVTRPT